jgi:transposase-like protein
LAAGAIGIVSRPEISLQESGTEMTEQERMKYAVPLMKSYSEAFKRKVVMEVENGILSKDGAKYRYGIRGNSRVLNWCRKYGRLQHRITQTRTMKNNDDTQSDPRKRIAELEKALERANLKVAVYETMLEVAKEKLGVDIKKKFGTKPLGE